MSMEHTKFQQKVVPIGDWGTLASDSRGLESFATRGKILIVDGSMANRRNVRATLGDLDHELVETSTTSEAIAAVSLHRLDLVLIDLAVPELGALDFCRMLKKATATQFLPVFVTAAADDIENEVRAIESGADGFLVRPLRPRVFRARIQASLRQKAMIDSLDDSETILFSLAQSVEERDPSLAQHCQHLASMAAAMGVTLGLAPPEILALQRGGYLHDIGKVAIPDHILFKPGPLTPEEWEVMKSHAERGERICSNMRSLAPVLPIIRHHHERWDGTGYPDGLKHDDIPLPARILQLADIYDALTTARPYKVALSPDDALGVLREEVAKGWRDPKLVEVFADILPMFRTSTVPDVSRLSLHALAASIERYRKDPARTDRRPALFDAGEPLKLISGL
jgi:putative two-component system response regulator